MIFPEDYLITHKPLNRLQDNEVKVCDRGRRVSVRVKFFFFLVAEVDV